MGQLAGAFALARTKPLVVAIDKLPPVVDDVEAVMRLVLASQSVRRPKDDPNSHLAGKLERLPCALLKQIPVQVVKRFDIGIGIPGESALRKMNNIRAMPLGPANLPRHVLIIGADIGANQKLATRDCDLHLLVVECARSQITLSSWWIIEELPQRFLSLKAPISSCFRRRAPVNAPCTGYPLAWSRRRFESGIFHAPL
jgi:hypothetical protein